MRMRTWVLALGGLLVLALVLGGAGMALAQRSGWTMNGSGLNGSGYGGRMTGGTPFGGMMSDPFETPVNRNGFMVLTGLRYNFPNDERTKMGFEFNHGSKYWFNFAQAEDDIIAPKTNTRGQVYETYFTHRINERFIFKADFIKYAYTYSGSGWHLGAPKKLDTNPILGFPTYSDAFKLSMGLIARF